MDLKEKIDEIKEEEDGDTLTPNEDSVEEEQSESAEDLMKDEEPEESIDSVGDGEVPSENPVDEEPVEKMFTQSQVNDIVGRVRQEGRDSALKDLYGRYGVNNDTELNDIFGRGQAYDALNDDYLMQGDRIKQVMAENALLKSHVDESRWDDIKLILGGKGLDITQENIESMMPTHPEWAGQNGSMMPAPMPPAAAQPAQAFSPEMGETLADQSIQNARANRAKPVTTLRKLGNDMQVAEPENNNNEEEQLKKLFGM